MAATLAPGRTCAYAFGMPPGRSSLGVRLTSIIAAVFLAFGVLQFGTIRTITGVQLRAIERRDLVERVRLLFQALSLEAAGLRNFTASYAAWEDSYEFVERFDPDFVERNFGGDWAGDYDTQLVMYVASDGRVVWASRRAENFRDIDIEAFRPDRFDPRDPYVFPAGPSPAPSDARVGLVKTPGGLLLYSVHPITDDMLKAEPRGVLIFGRIVDGERLASFILGSDDTITLEPSLDLSAVAGAEADSVPGIMSADKAPLATRIEGNAFTAYAPVLDMAGRPIATLRLGVLREIERTGDRFVWLTTATLLAVAIVTLSTVVAVVRKIVLLRIARLVAFFDAHAEGLNDMVFVDSGPKDEIGLLAEHAQELLVKSRNQTMELERLARTDRLTGLANRRHFDLHVDKETRRLIRDRRENCKRGNMAIVVLDVDHFKLYNDTYGHMAGDACLRAIADTAQSCVRRPEDLACRFGGEEFLLVLPDTDEEGALVVAESVRARVEGLGLPHASSPAAPVVTVSLGVAAAEVGDGFDIGALIERADKALYAAKNGGRNRVSGTASQASA